MINIKFRAWDTLDNKFLWPWPDGFHIFGEVTCFDLISQQLDKSPHDRKHSLDRLNDVIITQYTGLKDKNGKEIYEGDILQWEGAYRDIKWVVTWDTMDIHSRWHSTGMRYEIIGNKFENPELLNEQ
jgi:uncharacterized phage protein (TIGR01671 family)